METMFALQLLGCIALVLVIITLLCRRYESCYWCSAITKRDKHASYTVCESCKSQMDYEPAEPVTMHKFHMTPSPWAMDLTYKPLEDTAHDGVCAACLANGGEICGSCVKEMEEAFGEQAELHYAIETVSKAAWEDVVCPRCSMVGVVHASRCPDDIQCYKCGQWKNMYLFAMKKYEMVSPEDAVCLKCARE